MSNAVRTPASTSTSVGDRPLGYVPVLDGLRGLAVLWIILGHVRWRLQAPPPTGFDIVDFTYTASYFGVELLFVVSGFVLFLPAVLNRGSMGSGGRYALRRAARIVPAYYAAMALSYLVAWKVGGVRGGSGALLSHAFFLGPMAHSREDIAFGVNSPVWTMSVEVVFYIALPLVASWYYRHPFLGLGLVAGLAHGWHLLTVNLPGVLSWAGVSFGGTEDAQYRMAHAFPGFTAQFAVGMTAAWVYVKMRQRPLPELTRVAPAIAVVSAMGVLAVAGLRAWEVAHGTAGFYDHWTKTLDRSLLFGALALGLALSSARVQAVVANEPCRFLGTVCYGAYLTHLPLLYLLIPALGLTVGTGELGDLLLLSAVTVALSFAIGAVSYAALEEPVRTLVRRRRSPRPAAARSGSRPVALAGARG